MNNYSKYLPSPEQQWNPYLDYFNCTVYSALNLLETKLNKMRTEKTLSVGAMTFLNDYGFIDDDGSIDMNDRFTGAMDALSPKGNTFENVFASLTRDGILSDRFYPEDNAQSFEDYVKEPSDDLKAKAKEFLKYFKITYETASKIEPDELYWATIPICEGYGGALPAQPCVYPPSHAVLIYDRTDAIDIFDSYMPYRKRLALNYPIYAKWKLNIQEVNQTNLQTMIYGITADKNQYIVDYTLKFAYSIPNPQELENLKKSNPEMADLLSKPPVPIANIDGYCIIRGATANGWKEFLNL